jgi:hypothetical protein
LDLESEGVSYARSVRVGGMGNFLGH